ncbi:MAG: hypothetical protein GF344_11125, partial [Chitinivibrionales bacterium]|nr:hypothetical protein [Chitinivibrionales bacterium]MBD3357354.1 hypothetical protein [Chitinivibrionales bacterium]
MIFSENEIAKIAFPSVVERGRELLECGAVQSLQLVGSDTIACVRHDVIFRVVVGESEGQFACTCGFSMGGACEHVVAAMLALSRRDAVQTGLLLEPGDSTQEESTPAEEPPPVEEIRGKPRGRLYLTERGSMLLVELRFAYHGGCVEFSRGEPYKSRVVPDGHGGFVRILRARARELSLVSDLDEFGLVPYQAGTFTPSDDARQWVLDTLPVLSAQGYEIFGEANLRSFKTREGKPELSVSVAKSEGLLECNVSVNVDGVPVQLAAILQAARDNNRYVLLSDGSTGMLPEGWLQKFASLFAVFEHDTENDRVQIQPAQLPALDMLCEMADHTQTEESVERIRERFRDFRGIEHAPLPEGFEGSLRPYQQAGYDWLCFLRKHGFGGC